MMLPDRKESEARRLLESVPPAPVPPDLAGRALRRGRRVARRHRTAAIVLWGFFAVAVAVAVWAAVAEPWAGPPAGPAPPTGW